MHPAHPLPPRETRHTQVSSSGAWSSDVQGSSSVSRNYSPRASVPSVSMPPILEEATLTVTTAAGSGEASTATGTMAVATSLLVDGDAHSTSFTVIGPIATAIANTALLNGDAHSTESPLPTSFTPVHTDIAAIIGGAAGGGVVVGFLMGLVIVRRRRGRRERSHRHWPMAARVAVELSTISAGNTAIANIGVLVDPFLLYQTSAAIRIHSEKEGGGEMEPVQREDARSDSLAPPPTEDRDSETLPSYRSVAS